MSQAINPGFLNVIEDETSTPTHDIDGLDMEFEGKGVKKQSYTKLRRQLNNMQKKLQIAKGRPIEHIIRG